MKLEHVKKQRLVIGVECAVGVLCAVFMGYFFTVRDSLWDNLFLLVWLIVAVLLLVLLVLAERRLFQTQRQFGSQHQGGDLK